MKYEETAGPSKNRNLSTATTFERKWWSVCVPAPPLNFPQYQKSTATTRKKKPKPGNATRNN